MLNANQSKFVSDDSRIQEIELRKQELERETIKFRDERNEFNKKQRVQARLEQKMDYLELVLKENGNKYLTPHSSTSINSDNDVLVILSDLHIGAEYYSFSGMYNSDIAKERLEQYLGEILKIQKMHNSENCFISLQGDLISSNIHSTIAISNRENVIEQIKLVSELVSNFTYELSKHFNNVTVFTVNGNHSRITKKDDAVHDERLDDLVSWYMKAKLSHINNIFIKEDRLDSSISDIEIRGNIYCGLHGDYDSFSQSGVAKLVLMLGFKPYAFLYGHKHFPAMSDISGVKIIQSGSLGGSGDDYCIEHRLSGKPSQTVLVCNENGIYGYYPIELN